MNLTIIYSLIIAWYIAVDLTEKEKDSAVFEILIIRTEINDSLLIGNLYVNLEYIGTTYENNTLKIKDGKYPGFIRYISSAGHVQGPFGIMANSGDFLLEIGNVLWSDGKKRSNLLFHGGNKANQSLGCILLGPISINEEGNRYLPQDHALVKLKKLFYGNENPSITPNKKITIQITSNL